MVPDSVVRNLDVRTDDWPAYDDQPNHRLDGTHLGIETHQVFEGHGEVTEPYSEAMRWVVERLESIEDGA